MQAEELRIGNLVKDHLGRTQKVHEVRSDSYICYLSNGSKLKYKLNTTKPIPLTEEWVERHTDYESIQDLACDLDELVSSKTGMYLLVYTDTGIEYLNNLYVHQLQNLYFPLTNKELIIK